MFRVVSRAANSFRVGKRQQARGTETRQTRQTWQTVRRGGSSGALTLGTNFGHIALAGLLIGLLARLWLWTLRVRVIRDPGLDDASDRPWVLALWHGQLFSLLAHRRRKATVAMVSGSPDGELLAGAFRILDVHVVRGSSTRGGREALSKLEDQICRGWDGAFAVDGPKGPRGRVHSGALRAARASSGVVVPYAAACSRSFVLRRAWDEFEIPLPFATVAIALGPPIEPPPVVSPADRASLGASIDVGVRIAQESLEPTRPHPDLSAPTEISR